MESPEATTVSAPIDEGLPVRIVIPDLGIDVPVVEMTWHIVEPDEFPVSEWVIPRNEAGHHVNSAHLGQVGNIAISGHNNIYGKVFEPISQAWDNDSRKSIDAATDGSDILNGRMVQLYNAAGRRFDYRIEEFYRLKDTGVSLAQRQANARFMQPTEDARLTIITCWPPWNNTHRLILIARPAAGS
jgi:sortase A